MSSNYPDHSLIFSVGSILNNIQVELVRVCAFSHENILEATIFSDTNSLFWDTIIPFCVPLISWRNFVFRSLSGSIYQRNATNEPKLQMLWIEILSVFSSVVCLVALKRSHGTKTISSRTTFFRVCILNQIHFLPSLYKNVHNAAKSRWTIYQ